MWMQYDILQTIPTLYELSESKTNWSDIVVSKVFFQVGIATTVTPAVWSVNLLDHQGVQLCRMTLTT